MTMTQNQADALAQLLGWDGAPFMPIDDRDQAICELIAAGTVAKDGEEFYVINPMATAECIMDSMQAGVLAR